MPVSVGSTFKLHYKLTENSKLRKDISYEIIAMEDETFEKPLLDSGGQPATPCVQILDDGQVLAISVGYAQIKIQSEEAFDVNAVCNITVLPRLDSINTNVNEVTLLEK